MHMSIRLRHIGLRKIGTDDIVQKLAFDCVLFTSAVGVNLYLEDFSYSDE